MGGEEGVGAGLSGSENTLAVVTHELRNLTTVICGASRERGTSQQSSAVRVEKEREKKRGK